MHHMFSRTLRLFAAIVLVAATASPSRAESNGLRNAFLITAKQHSYHITITASRGDVWQGDVVNPDRVHMVAAGIESITIGNTSYLKQKGVWQKVVADPHSGNPSNVLARYRADSHSTDLGTRMVDGVALHAYRIDHAKTHRMEMIFVDNADRIVRIESGATVMRMSNYNEAVTISPPM